MSVKPITQLLQDSLLKSDQSLTFLNDSAFNKTLNMGQIIKGKVLRQYDGNHYSVNFNGQEKVVDSAVPLKTGELIYGRVVGLGDKVKLQKVSAENANPQNQIQQTNQKNYDQLSAKERMLEQLFARYQEKLSVQDRQIILKELNRAAHPDLMALSSLVLKKVGLVQAPTFLQALFKQLNTSEQNRMGHDKALLNIQTEPNGILPESENAIQTLTALISELAESKVENHNYSQAESLMNNEHSSSDGQRDSQFNEKLLGRRILNTQNGGTVDHWYTSIPIWVNGKIVEINMALFNQQQSNTPNANGVNFKKLVFSLETGFLGSVEISVVCANRNLRINVITDDEYAAEYMATYITDLKGALQKEGWDVEEINYSVADSGFGEGVVRSVVEHHITNNSLNQLI